LLHIHFSLLINSSPGIVDIAQRIYSIVPGPPGNISLLCASLWKPRGDSLTQQITIHPATQESLRFHSLFGIYLISWHQ
jgi:hypothetical protein